MTRLSLPWFEANVFTGMEQSSQFALLKNASNDES